MGSVKLAVLEELLPPSARVVHPNTHEKMDLFGYRLVFTENIG